jgi:hypothetical protein
MRTCEISRNAVLTVSQGKSIARQSRDTPNKRSESLECEIGNALKLKRRSGHTSARDGTWDEELEALEMVEFGSLIEAG